MYTKCFLYSTDHKFYIHKNRNRMPTRIKILFLPEQIFISTRRELYIHSTNIYVSNRIKILYQPERVPCRNHRQSTKQTVQIIYGKNWNKVC